MGLRYFTKDKFIFVIFLLGVAVILYFIQCTRHVYIEENHKHFIKLHDEQLEISKNKRITWRHFENYEVGNLSNLARILYLQEVPPPATSNKIFKILIWKYGKTIEKRHIKHFGNESHDPFEKCSVTNCEISYEEDDFRRADLVLFHLHRTKGVNDLPNQDSRNPDQIWTFLTDESPYHTFMHSNKLEDYNNIFNWSMTYSYRSDIPVPYGRTVVLPRSVPENEYDTEAWNKKRLAAILISNCGSNNHRKEYLKELQEYIPVDVYGGCGDLKCPGHFDRDCEAINDYKFYLSFENSNCNEYVTEKAWWNAYSKNSIPIIMGAPESSLSKLLPPGSYINVEAFASPRDLATYIGYTSTNRDEFKSFFNWKKDFQVLQEHGYFKSDSYHYCRICEALNYNSREKKVYGDLHEFWSTEQCHPSWDSNNPDKDDY